MTAETDFAMESSDSEYGDNELQQAFAEGKLKPGLNIPEELKKPIVNNVVGLVNALKTFKKKLPWIEILDSVNGLAPIAPEMAAKLLTNEQKRANELQNNKKLPQFKPEEDPVLNDFKRETMFHRQAQACVLDCFPKLKAMGMPCLRPDDYFAQMAKTDDHMQKIRTKLMEQEEQQKRSEKVKQIRLHKQQGKAIANETRVKRIAEKRELMNNLKKAKKGKGADLSFLENGKKPMKTLSNSRVKRNEKYGMGGKKKGSKRNTKESSGEYGSKKGAHNKGSNNKRPGKGRRMTQKRKGKN
ncbi:PREDICTED: probable rRNA-processing protein EBP2 homolog [Nicrophorus vespilloides]|uniref:Probable rRNA-processing protein EBP2 homolog n=1 Tax=Nicrophorus vespilloides TaxID=110193 RepID=A0ABM1NCN0_NICVS|nr:PREDICTED: probable rRNA-processing protein EBP2 homolog [Nicrophorus vespilloides]